MIEVVVALALAVIVMTSTAAFFVRGLTETRLMQQRQSAIAVAEQAMERVRADAPASIAGRDETRRGGASLVGDEDPSYRVNNVDYVVHTKVTDCGMAPGGGPCDGVDSGDVVFYRITITVQWPPAAHASCGGAGLCEYTLTTLRDPAGSSTERLQEIPQS